jgi:hypothetical protein
MAGKPVQRTKGTHPYAYHPFVVYRALPNEALTAGTYSDRLRQNDWSKAEALTLEHFSDTSHYWRGREPARIEALLRDFTEQPSLEMGVVLKGCNVSSGPRTGTSGGATRRDRVIRGHSGQPAVDQ